MQFMRSQRVGHDLAPEQQHNITIVTLVTSKIKHLSNDLEILAQEISRQDVESANWLLQLPKIDFPGSSAGKESARNAGDPGSIPGFGRPLEKGQATHSSIFGFPGGSDGKESTCNVGNLGLIPGLGQYPGRGHGNPL